MAKNDNSINTKKINQMLDNVDKQIDSMHKTTYGTSDTNRKLFKKVSDDLEKSINNVVQGDIDTGTDVANTTRLYLRMAKQGNGEKSNPILSGDDNNMLSMFSDNSFIGELMNEYADTVWIKRIDNEIDMVLKYMPILKTALDIKKDNVLSSDSFSKEFTSISTTNSFKDGQFAANAGSLKASMNFENLCEEIYDDVSRYGEYFLYQVPFSRALKELLDRKNGVSAVNGGILFPSSIKEETIIENGSFGNGFRSLSNAIELDKNSIGSINLSFHRAGILEDAVSNLNTANTIKGKLMAGLYESYLTEVSNENIAGVHLDKTIPTDKNGNMVGSDLDYGKDGFYDIDDFNKSKNKPNNILKVPGCVIRKIKRDEIIPIYIENICIGYYVINIRSTKIVDDNITSGFNSISNLVNKGSNRNEVEGDQAIKYIAGSISQHIDANFINANQDLSKEIYMILKYNDRYNVPINSVNIDITFLPPEDVLHIKFKTDPITHRGISDIWDGLTQAKLWIMLNQTLSIGTVTRGQDRRVYYVKQTVESNVAKSLLNVISQIKKGNFGIRQMESINNILGMLGKFNDFVIPVGPNGDPPVNFEIMPGQQIDIPTELMNDLKESAVNSTDIPLEVAQSSNSMDFAIRYSMTNSKMLRMILRRQAKCEYYFSQIFTKSYNCTYEKNYDIKVSLPAPAYLTMVNGSQLIDNTKSYINSIADVVCVGKTDMFRNKFVDKMFRHYIPTHVNIDLVDELMKSIETVDIPVENSETTEEESQ